MTKVRVIRNMKQSEYEEYSKTYARNIKKKAFEILSTDKL